MTQHITVVSYDAGWPDMFKTEADEIKAILGSNCAEIYHIGSTAVPGLAAKPIIDIMPTVYDLNAVDTTAEAFEKIGYEYLGKFGIKGRRYLRKGGDERTHQIHIFQVSDRENIARHIAVRDFMRSHREVREQYAQLKFRLAAQYPYDIEGYCDGKDEFVKEMEEKALIWAGERSMSTLDKLTEKERYYYDTARRIGVAKGDCKELQDLYRQALADRMVGIISDEAYKLIYSICIELAYPR